MTTTTVWASASELQEYREVIEPGDRLHRTALPWEPPFLPPGSARWALDRYALVAGVGPVRIDGTVVGIRRISGTHADAGGTPQDVTLLDVPRADGRGWSAPARDDGLGEPDGRGGRWVAHRPRRGDELHLGWLIDLIDARITPAG